MDNETPPERSRSKKSRRLMLLATTTGYQTQAFVEAAERAGAGVVFGTDRCHMLEDPWRDGALALRFEDPDASANQIVEYAQANPLDGIVALGDRPTPTAARACQRLGLSCHPPRAADACRHKYRSRELLGAAGLNVPRFRRFPLAADPYDLIEPASQEVDFPCVLKPLSLSGSRGVIRADNVDDFIQAFERIRALLRSPEVRVLREETSDFIQVESYVEGREIAVEGLVDRGRLRVLAVFDKPDPLVGPFFEETIYVTPTRLSPQVQLMVAETLERAVDALGLFHGPLHAELRINPEGVWILEVAARSIGGLCARSLRFSSANFGEGISLEELLVRHALGEATGEIRRERAASGVMMIPIPAAGIYQGVEGIDEARSLGGVEDLFITAKQGENLIPLPEGSSYLGFIFARGPSTEFVENALRRAHQKLRFAVSPALPVI